MKRFLRETLVTLYAVGLFGRRERVDLTRVTWVEPTDERERAELLQVYAAARAQLWRLKVLLTKIGRLESKIDAFNKAQLCALSARPPRPTKWYDRFQRPIARELAYTLISKRNIETLQLYAHQLLGLVLTETLSFPIEEDDYILLLHFTEEVAELRRDYATIRRLTKAWMVERALKIHDN